MRRAHYTVGKDGRTVYRNGRQLSEADLNADHIHRLYDQNDNLIEIDGQEIRRAAPTPPPPLPRPRPRTRVEQLTDRYKRVLG